MVDLILNLNNGFQPFSIISKEGYSKLLEFWYEIVYNPANTCIVTTTHTLVVKMP